jgi:antitoxin ParD1/3/4
MPTRNVVLTNHQESLIESLVESGRYQNASEVLREGLRLVERQETQDAARLVALRDATRLGIAAIEAGEHQDFAEGAGLAAWLDALGEAAIAEARKR